MQNIQKILLLLLLIFYSCSTEVGNPQPAPVKLRSLAFNTAAKIDIFKKYANTLKVTGISNFSFCVTQFTIESSQGSHLLEAQLGLISPDKGTSDLHWGQIQLTQARLASVIKVTITKDKILCGVDYSTNLNGQSLNRNIELIFNLTSESTLNGGETIIFNLENILNQFIAAQTAGKFTDNLISEFLALLTGEALVE